MSTAPPPFLSINGAIDGRITVDIHDIIDDNTLKDVIDSVSKVDKSIVTRNLNAILDSPEHQNLIEENIKQLAKKTLATRAAFEEIRILLYSFDREKLKTNNGTEIGPLGPRWDDLYKRYNDILKKSHNDAVITKGVCDDYIETVLAIPNEPGATLKDMQVEIDAFIKRTNKAKKAAESDASSFDRLTQDVNNYRKEIYDSFESVDADPGGRISSLELEIEQLKTKISRLQKLIKGTTIAALSGGAAANVTLRALPAVGGILLSFCPTLAVLLAGGILLVACIAGAASILGAAVLRHRMEKARCGLEKKEKELVQLRAQVSKLEDLKAQLNQMETPFKDIVMQLSALTHFWQSVDAQCQEILINLNKGEEAKSDFSVKKFLGDELSGSSYRALSRALAIYVSQMTQLE